ncbi:MULTISPECIES: cupin domain-containing protein [Deefgea]|uniref:DUF861 domain-containing protein n=1 Tax=Deefgea chitinilytica TaxID=570276 RepID=A0ABS2CA47_9NEIS|nr:MULTISPECIES: cupin domain-containing protein [Deefgea]MBM5571023.1 DUF861 domain-containing protein [Deefgea chitinilytica]MBM9888253.1 cupin domain-containing protein [Deefgea sp. CFH1-16]
MQQIHVERQISTARQAELKITYWPIWEKNTSTFAWTYDSSETCFLIAGEVTVTPDGGEPVTITAGDLAIFPAGMSCTWHITQNLRKHYHFA